MTVTITTIAIIPRRDLGLASAPVVAVAGAGNTVVGAVARLKLAAVRGGSTLGSISLDTAPHPSCAVRGSSIDADSLTSVAPSARQNFSASLVSRRWHCGQRFM